MKVLKTMKQLVIYTAIICSVVANTSLFAQNWNRVGEDLHDISMQVNGKIYAVGDFGTVLFSNDLGKTWMFEDVSVYNHLYEIDFWNSEKGCIIGDSGTILYTENGGVSWIRSESPVGTSRFLALAITDGSDGYISNINGEIFKTNDNGITWKLIISEEIGTVYGLHFKDSQSGVAVTEEGRIYTTNNGGAEWEKVFEDVQSSLYDVDFLGNDIGIAGGLSGYLLKSIDGGKSWIKLEHANNRINAVSVKILEDSTIIVMGAEGNTIDKSSILVSDDRGNTWNTPSFDPIYGRESLIIQGVSAVAPNTLVSVGNMGVIVCSPDKGRSWLTVSQSLLTFPGFGTASLRDFAFASSDTGVILNNLLGNGYWQRTTDRGITWNLYRRLFTDKLLDPVFFNSEEGVMSGDLNDLYKTANAGFSWSEVESARNPNVASTNAMKFVDRDYGYIVGDTLFYKTTNGGASWEGAPFQWATTLYNVHFISRETGFVVGQRFHGFGSGLEDSYRVYRTDDGGEEWKVIYERDGFDFGIGDICFINKDTGFLAVGRPTGYNDVAGGYIYTTTDGGDSWDSIATIGGTPSDIEFFNENLGYAVGSSATIFVTIDGGKQWVLERPLPYISSDDKQNLYRVQLLPDGKTVVITGEGIILRKSFPNQLSSISEGVQNDYSNDRELHVRVHPNPSNSNTVHVIISNVTAVEAQNIDVSICDLFGRTLIANQLYKPDTFLPGTSIEVDVSSIPNGTYMMQVQIAERKGTHLLKVVR